MKFWTAIIAIGKNGLIGKDDNLPWKIEEETCFFRETVENKKVLMGRKTFESLKYINDNSKYIILTSNKEYDVKIENKK